MNIAENEVIVGPAGNVRAMAWCPGNGTRYELVATRLDGIQNGFWLVASPNFGGNILVREDSYLAESYVQEKFVPRSGRPLDEGDLQPVTRGIARLVPDVRCGA